MTISKKKIWAIGALFVVAFFFISGSVVGPRKHKKSTHSRFAIVKKFEPQAAQTL